MNLRNKLIFYGDLLASRPTPKMEDHPLLLLLLVLLLLTNMLPSPF
jgi:hypothetical protein